MAPDAPKLTYLLKRDDRRIPPPSPAPPLREVREPAPRFARLRKYLRPWRLMGKLTLVGLPFWVTAGVLAIGGWAAGAMSGLIESLTSVAQAGTSAAIFLAVLPIGLLAAWAGILALVDAGQLPEREKMQRAFKEASARLGQPDVLTPDDMRRTSVREALTMLAHMRHMLDELSRADRPFSGVLLDSLRESLRLMERSVLELVETERQLAEWSGRLGQGAGYPVQLQQRRQALLNSYPEIIDRCLKATDKALAKQARADGRVGSAVFGGGGELEKAVSELLERCQRAIDKVDATDYDEQEFLRYAAKEADAGPAALSADASDFEKNRDT